VLHELDPIVDSLATDIGRSVLIADRRQRVVAYSAGHDDSDPVRVQTILNRASPPAMERWVSSLGIHHATRPTRAPANPQLGSAPRVCVPIRRDARLFGFIWLLDAHGDLGDVDIASVADEARSAADIMFRADLLASRTRVRERRLLDGLLSSDADVRANAVAAAARRDVFDVDGKVCGVAVTLASPHRANGSEFHRELETVGERARRFWPPRRLLARARGDHCLLLVACPRNGAGVPALAARLRDELDGRAVGIRSAAGIGSVGELGRARSTAEEALRAASVGLAIPDFGRAAAWDNIGVYRLLASMGDVDLDPMIVQLLGSDLDGSLVRTVETYLDLGGDVKTASAQLTLHRTSLYYRLKKVEAIVGASLKDGDVRLCLQLGLKLARLRGQLVNEEHNRDQVDAR
jgi:sugar diacid utilization regulator